MVGSYMEGGFVIENGYKYDSETGVLIGQYLEPDKYNVHSAPLFIYNRTDRFYVLCLSAIPGPQKDVTRCVRMFQSLEDVWNSRKEMYVPRKYFLSQKLLCKQICSHLNIKCTIERAIQDKKRLAAQLRIYDDLLCNIKCQHVCTWEDKPNNTISVPPPNCHLLAGKLRRTRFETHALKTICKLPWPSNSG